MTKKREMLIKKDVKVNKKCSGLISRVSKKVFLRVFIFADGPENYFSRKFNFSNCLYFPRNRENFFPWKFLRIKYLFSCFYVAFWFYSVLFCSVLIYRNLTFIQKKYVCEKQLFFSSKINFRWNLFLIKILFMNQC